MLTNYNHMLPLLLLALAALALAILRLLEETPAESNLRLTVRMSGAAPRRLCRAVNARLEAGRQLRLEALRGERELKYTMACISHDIRTPLAGAMGYLQLLEGEPERQVEYLGIVKKRLGELEELINARLEKGISQKKLEELGQEELLEELFLYTRLRGGAFPMECRKTAVLPPLWDALAEFYPQLDGAGIRPDLQFDREDMQVWASPEALGRVYRNLIANTLRHGGGGLTVSGGQGTVCFSNVLLPGAVPDVEHLFDRFYQGSPARGEGGAGLGLSIVRELMEQMGGRVSARIDGDILRIMLMFSPGPDSRAIPHEGDAPGGGHIGRYR